MDEVFQDLDDYFTIDNSLGLLLMEAGEKPGVLIMSATPEQKEKIEEICGEKNWDWKVYGGSIEENSFIDRFKKLLGFSVRDPFDTAGIFVARDEERFKILENSSGKFYGASEEAVGDFLGYDGEAVEFYTGLEEGETAAEPYEEKVEEMLDSGTLDEEDLKYLELVFYMPVPIEDKILEARDLGRKRWRVLSGTDTGDRFLEELERQL
ncbi:MAG: hypothetical protein ABEJ36_03280 [Candidatus Nanosalina sp.]